MIPVLIMVVIGLWQSDQKRAIFLWVSSLTLAIIVTVVSKVLFIGWGIGIAALDFTGISGHALLATSILPVLFYLVIGTAQKKLGWLGLWLGLALAIAVAISRLVIGAHSFSEVFAGCLLGMGVSGLGIRTMTLTNQNLRPGLVRVSLLILLLAFDSNSSGYLPSHYLEIRLALFLSGHDHPYSRAHSLPVSSATTSLLWARRTAKDRPT